MVAWGFIPLCLLIGFVFGAFTIIVLLAAGGVGNAKKDSQSDN